ncbi:MAG TPA: hypothetical protein VIA18_21200, partial [Polyangia bacterium]|nr:hypothetical protein [Polyangia bacterium]
MFACAPLVGCGSSHSGSHDSGVPASDMSEPPADFATPPSPDLAMQAGSMTLLAGGLGGVGDVDGTGAAARFDGPQGAVYDGAGNLYVADGYNDTIRKIVLATGVVTTVAGSARVTGTADGVGAAALFTTPVGIVSDGAGDLFITDTDNNSIRKMVIATGNVTTIAGTAGVSGSTDGIGIAASFNAPHGIAFDGAGNLFIADRFNATIRQIVIATGAVTTLAGTAGTQGTTDGTGAAALFDNPIGIISDGAGNLYVSEYEVNTIRKIVVASGVVTTLAGTPNTSGGTDGTGAAATFTNPESFFLDGSGNLYVTDVGDYTIRKIVVATGVVTTVA